MTFNLLTNLVLFYLLFCYGVKFISASEQTGEILTNVQTTGHSSQNQQPPQELSGTQPSSTPDQQPQPQTSQSNSELAELCSQFLVITYDKYSPNNLTENDQNKYDFEINQDFAIYKFRKDAKCLDLKYNDVTIWKHIKQYGNDYPIDIVITKEKKVIVRLQKFDFEYIYKVDKWILYFLCRIIDIIKVQVTIITADDHRGLNAVENDLTKYYETRTIYSSEYKFRDNAKCISFKCGDQVVWRHNLKKHWLEFPKEITLNRSTNDVTVKFKNFLIYHYKCTVFDSKNIWKLKSVEGLDKFYIAKLKIITSDDGSDEKLASNDNNKYTEIENKLSLELKFDKGPKCYKVLFEDNILWSYKGNPEHGFPYYIHYDINMRVLLIHFNNYLYTYFCDYGGFYPLSTKDGESLSVSEVKIITLDDSSPPKLNTNDTNKFKIKHIGRSNKVFKFEFDYGAKCVGVQYADTTVWECKETEYHFPSAIYFTCDTKTIIIWFDPELFYIYRYMDEEWKLKVLEIDEDKEFKEDKETFDDTLVYDLRIFTSDDGKPDNIMVNNRNSYEVKRYSFGYTYNFINRSKCVAVKLRDSVVWNHDVDIHGDKFPKYVHFDIQKPEMIKVEFGEDWYYSYEFMGDKFLPIGIKDSGKYPKYRIEEHTEVDEEETAGALARKGPIEIEQQKFIKEKVPVEDSELELELPPKIIVVTADDGYGTNSKENDKDKFLLDKIVTVYECLFLEGAKCIEVKYDNNIVWKYDPNLHFENYPKVLYFDSNEIPMFTVFFKDFWSYTYKWNGERWILKSSITPEMCKPQVPENYEEHTECDDTLIETVKSEQSEESEEFDETEKMISELYPKLDPKPLEELELPDQKDMIILNESEFPKNIKIFTLDDNDDTKTKENDNTKFVMKCKIHSKNLIKFEFKDGGKCVKVDFKDKTVWTHVSIHGNYYPREVYLVKSMNMILVVFNENWYYIYELINDKFEVIVTKQEDPEAKRLSSQDDVEEYDMEDENNEEAKEL